MNKIIKFIIIILIVAAIGVSAFYIYNNNFALQVINFGDSEADVRNLVENFGMVLKNVTLISPTASQEIEENYKNFIDPDLLEQWKADPQKAVGRITSSPWPENIEIAGVTKGEGSTYNVEGKIIQMTSTGAAGFLPVEITAARIKNRWVITKATVTSGLWKEGKASNGQAFQYPDRLLVQYISAQEWPPVVEILPGTFSCNESGGVNAAIARRMVDDRVYCVKTESEGAAGSVYYTYSYVAQKGDNLAKVSFTLRYVNCQNYSEPQDRICQAEREAFDLDGIVDKIVQTIK